MPVSPRHLVERFYHEVWNRADETVAREILHAEFRFRGSLGSEKRGPEGFIDYMRAVHAALGGYLCHIEDLVEGEDLVAGEGRAAAKMRFVGAHRAEFFGVPATGLEIEWAGAAFFTTDGAQITDLWVLGDLDAVKRQLGAVSQAQFLS